MQGKKFLHSIQIKNLLSYGGKGVSLDLEPLNVLIGPNASGKSNLIEAISLLAAAPRDLMRLIREGGGIDEWIWKGSDGATGAQLQVVLEDPLPFRYGLEFIGVNSRLQILNEFLNNDESGPSVKPYSYYSFNQGRPIRTRVSREDGFHDRIEAELHKTVSSEESIFSQQKDMDIYPELAAVGEHFDSIRFFRDWSFGCRSLARKPQRVGLPNAFPQEDFSNLGLVLSSLQNSSEAKQVLVKELRNFYEDAEDITTKTQDGLIEIFVHEKYLREPVPAARLSDGMLHYLCLLTVLLHPGPPPLLCIEEPELGLHPDIVSSVARLLIEASQRTQLIVTTHSEMLVSAFSETSEAIVVCERGIHGTILDRLDPVKLKEYLDRYQLGELWAMGEIGGNRW